MNYSKKLWALLALFVLCAGLSFAQNSGSGQNQNLSQSQIEESQFTFDTETTDTAAVQSASGSGFWAFVRMIIVLAIVIGVIYFIFRLMKKTIEPGNDNDPFLRKVAGISVGPGKSVQVVTLIDKAYLVGVSENSINLIAEIDDKELINAMNLHSDKTTNQFKAKSFAEVLDMFMPKKPSSAAETESNSGSVFDSSTQDLIDSLKKKKMGGVE